MVAVAVEVAVAVAAAAAALADRSRRRRRPRPLRGSASVHAAMFEVVAFCNAVVDGCCERCWNNVMFQLVTIRQQLTKSKTPLA